MLYHVFQHIAFFAAYTLAFPIASTAAESNADWLITWNVGPFQAPKSSDVKNTLDAITRSGENVECLWTAMQLSICTRNLPESAVNGIKKFGNPLFVPAAAVNDFKPRTAKQAEQAWKDAKAAGNGSFKTPQ